MNSMWWENEKDKEVLVIPYKWTDTPWEIGLFNKTRIVRQIIDKDIKELLEKYNE